MSDESQTRRVLDLAVAMLNDMGMNWAAASEEDRQAFAQNLFSEIVFDLDTRQIMGFKLKPWAEPFLQARVAQTGTTWVTGGVPSLNKPLDAPDECMRQVLIWLYAGRPAILQSREKRERNAEILRRHLSGERTPPIALSFGLSGRRVRAIIQREQQQYRTEYAR